MKLFSMEELKIIFSEAEIGSLEKLDSTLILHEKMRRVILLIYETSALQNWAYEPDDYDNVSIADLLRDVYKMLKSGIS